MGRRLRMAADGIWRAALYFIFLCFWRPWLFVEIASDSQHAALSMFELSRQNFSDPALPNPIWRDACSCTTWLHAASQL
ncbi:hypothetical protein LY78DRAFT_129330 [Colletotrichum sublineola]|nr:hypothetical protein LY78DRAFT_129330 [Colletotrichum sublineola]